MKSMTNKNLYKSLPVIFAGAIGDKMSLENQGVFQLLKKEAQLTPFHFITQVIHAFEGR